MIEGEASLESVRNEFDARLTPIERTLARIEARLDGTGDTALNVLRLIVSVVAPLALALAAWVVTNDRVVAAESKARHEIVKRDLYWLQKRQDEILALGNANAAELTVRTGRIARLDAFTGEQAEKNARQESRLDRLDAATSISKNELERDAIAEIREDIRRLEAGVRNGSLTNKEAAQSHLHKE